MKLIIYHNFRPTLLHIAWMSTLLAAAVLLPTIGKANDATEAAIEEALASVRNNNIETENYTSSVLGQLASPVELAGSQPNLRALYKAPEKRTVDFTEAEREEYRRHFQYFTFTGHNRGWLVQPMGITGAFFREFANRSQAVITSITPETPADGVLAINDIVIGANGLLFAANRDPRIALGYAVAESQTERLGGTLILQIIRDGEPMNVSLELGVTGEYSQTWPYDCEKSDRIVDRLVRYILDQDPPYLSGRGDGWFWGPMFMMATGDEEALELVRRTIHRMAKIEPGWDPSETNRGHSWNCSYSLVNISQYYLLTGDSSVLPTIKFLSEILEKGQSGAGGYGHSCPCSGYGEVNNVGFVALMGMALARECRTEMNPVSLPKSIRYFGRWIGGSAPYGNHRGGGYAGRGDNSSASMGALSFKFLGEENVAYRWGRAASYMWMSREAGHGERIFNFSWSPLGIALGTREEFAMHMNNVLWLYELGKTPDGAQRYIQQTHFSSPVSQTTAGGMVYTLPRRVIYVTGADKSVFAMKPPCPQLDQAAEAFKQKDWTTVRSILHAYTADTSQPHQDYALKLLDAYQRMERNASVTMSLIKKSYAAGNLEKTKRQLEALERLLGEMRPEMTKIAAMLPEKPKSLPRTKHVMPDAQNTLEPYVHEIDMSTMHSKTGGDWEFILRPAAATQADGEMFYFYRASVGERPDLGRWYDIDYDTTDWRKTSGAINPATGEQVWIRRTFTTVANPTAYKLLQTQGTLVGDIYLNGYRIADGSGEESNLRPGITCLLRKDQPNVLAIRVVGTGRPIDFGLRASPPVIPNLDNVLDDF